MTDNLENKTKKEILIVDDEYSNNKNLKVIVNSGGSYNSNDFKKYKNVIKFLQKPYGLDELKNSVKDALYNSH